MILFFTWPPSAIEGDVRKYRISWSPNSFFYSTPLVFVFF